MAYTSHRVMIGRPLTHYIDGLPQEVQDAVASLRRQSPDLVHRVYFEGDGHFVFFGLWIGLQEILPGFTPFASVIKPPTAEQESKARAFCDALPPVLAKNTWLLEFDRWFVQQEN